MMERRFRIRWEERRGDAEVHPPVWRGVLPRRESFLRPFVECRNATEQRTHAKHDVAGSVSDLPSKEAESIADPHDRDRRGWPKFIGPVEWDDGPPPTALVRPVGTELGEADGVLVCAPSAVPTKGTASVGVPRPWCGRLGTLDRGRVGIYLGYVSRREHARVDVRRSLPTEWAGDRKRRKKAGVPVAIRFRTRHEWLPERVDERGDSLPHAGISGDDAWGRCSWLRGPWRSRGESDLLAVPSNTAVRDLQGPDPPSAGRGRRPRSVPPSRSLAGGVAGGSLADDRGPRGGEGAGGGAGGSDPGAGADRGSAFGCRGVPGRLPRAAIRWHLEARGPAVERPAGDARGGVRSGVPGPAPDRGRSETGHGGGGPGRRPGADVGRLAPPRRGR
jgi:hypothetical protein